MYKGVEDTPDGSEHIGIVRYDISVFGQVALDEGGGGVRSEAVVGVGVA
jgi:hypothetical protein